MKRWIAEPGGFGKTKVSVVSHDHKLFSSMVVSDSWFDADLPGILRDLRKAIRIERLKGRGWVSTP